jgi:hypothetical protein
MRYEHQFRPPTRRFHRCHGKSRFPARCTGEDEFAVIYAHAVKLLRVVQAEQSVFHFFRSCEFGQHRRHVAAGSLHSAGRVQFGKKSNEHAVSLTNRADETQGPAVFLFGQLAFAAFFASMLFSQSSSCDAHTDDTIFAEGANPAFSLGFERSCHGAVRPSAEVARG